MFEDHLTKKTTRVAGGRAKVLAFCATVMVAILLELLLAANPAHATTFTVINTDDSGAGSLRQAITDANASTGADTIKFNIPGSETGCNATSGVCTISSSSELPEITDPVIIDGYSQPGASRNTLAVGNDAVLKIELSGASILPPGSFPNGLKIKAAKSTVKGLVISNWENGVFLDTDATGNTVRGNFIGTDASGADLGNNIGVVALGANNTIGGTTPAARNIISANSVFGIRIAFPGAAGNKVQGNYIGTNARGTEALGNGNDGVRVQEDADNNIVGGAVTNTSNPRNVISGNGGDGVEIFGSSIGTTGNRILSNSIYDNNELGIDLVHENDLPGGVTSNDDGDGDVGPNNMQNFADITSARTGRRATTIKGTLNSTSNTTFIIQFFSSPAADATIPCCYGEGQKFKGQKSVTTDSIGDASFTFKTKKKVPKGQVVTATATNQVTGDTSEFSEAVLVT